MSHRLPQRGVLTDLLLEFLESVMVQDETQIVVCDGLAQPGVGWPGDPGEGSFVPYTVLKTGPANTIAAEPTTLGGQHGTWLCGYLLSSYGSSRQQCDWCADTTRAAVLRFDQDEPLDLGEQWSIESITFNQLGPVDQNQAITPALWSATDQVFLRINRAKRRGT